MSRLLSETHKTDKPFVMSIFYLLTSLMTFTTMTHAPPTSATSGVEQPKTTRDYLSQFGHFSIRRPFESQYPHKDKRDSGSGPSEGSTLVKPTTRQASGARGLYDRTGLPYRYEEIEYRTAQGGKNPTGSIPQNTCQALRVHVCSPEPTQMGHCLTGGRSARW